MYQAVGSGASGRASVPASSASSSSRSLARMRAKCIQRGFIRKRRPSGERARLKWLAMLSCQS
jgi:hypothetical protein